MLNLRSKVLLTVLVIGFAGLLPSCSQKNTPPPETPESTVQEKKDYQEEGYLKGVVIDQTGLDGCSYLINLQNNGEINPVNLPDQFKKDQLAVWVKYQMKKGAASICMRGKLVNIKDIQLRKEGN